ncbi:MAG: hypothetical protein FWB74_03440 [Defluviitaleaceae bacterium]|nr:hypothetical protein [Defluviitaleaceae bacterium]
MIQLSDVTNYNNRDLGRGGYFLRKENLYKKSFISITESVKNIIISYVDIDFTSFTEDLRQNRLAL